MDDLFLNGVLFAWLTIEYLKLWEIRLKMYCRENNAPIPYTFKCLLLKIKLVMHADIVNNSYSTG